MWIIVRIVAAVAISFVAISFVTAEVLRPPQGKSQQEFSQEAVRQKRNVVVVRPDANARLAARGTKTAGATLLGISMFLLWWAVEDWRISRIGRSDT